MRHAGAARQLYFFLSGLRPLLLRPKLAATTLSYSTQYAAEGHLKSTAVEIPALEPGTPLFRDVTLVPSEAWKHNALSLPRLPKLPSIPSERPLACLDPTSIELVYKELPPYGWRPTSPPFRIPRSRDSKQMRINGLTLSNDFYFSPDTEVGWRRFFIQMLEESALKSESVVSVGVWVKERWVHVSTQTLDAVHKKHGTLAGVTLLDLYNAKQVQELYRSYVERRTDAIPVRPRFRFEAPKEARTYEILYERSVRRHRDKLGISSSRLGYQLRKGSQTPLPKLPDPEKERLCEANYGRYFLPLRGNQWTVRKLNNDGIAFTSNGECVAVQARPGENMLFLRKVVSTQNAQAREALLNAILDLSEEPSAPRTLVVASADLIIVSIYLTTIHREGNPPTGVDIAGVNFAYRIEAFFKKFADRILSNNNGWRPKTFANMVSRETIEEVYFLKTRPHRGVMQDPDS